MKILTQNNLTSFQANNLTEELGADSHHLPDLMLNEYPNAEWISDFPQPDTGYTSLSKSIQAFGEDYLNGVYIGNHTCDALTYDLYQYSSSYIQVGTTPLVTVDTSFKDHFFTVDQASQSEITSNFRIDLTATVNQSRIVSGENISFVITSMTTESFQAANGESCVTLLGYLEDASGNRLSSESDKFTEPIRVGMNLVVQFSDGHNRLAQVREIRGFGTADEGINLNIRQIEDPTGATGTSSNFLAGPQTITVPSIFSPIRIGIFRAGKVLDFPNPQVGLSKSYKDFSVRRNLLNGGHQFINRNIAKTYSGSLILYRDAYSQFADFVEDIRAKPFPVDLFSDFPEEEQTVIFGYFSSTPSISMSQRRGVIRDVNFSIQQVF